MPSATIQFPDGRTGTISANTMEELRSQVERVTASFRQQNAPAEAGLFSGPLEEPQDVPRNRNGGYDWARLTPDQKTHLANRTLDAIRSRDSDTATAVGAGTTEVLSALGTSAIAAPVSGVAGLAGLGFGSVPGGESPSEKANKWLQNTASALTDDPETEAGKYAFGQIGGALQGVTNSVRDVVEVAPFGMGAPGPYGALQTELNSRFAGNPILSTIVETALLGTPDVVAGGRMGVRRAFQNEAKSIVDAQARRLGIEIGSSRMREQMGEAARDRTVSYRGENMAAIGEKLLSEYNAAKAKTQAAYDAAGETRAGVRVPSVEEFGTEVQYTLWERGYDLQEPRFAGVRRLIEDTEAIYKGSVLREGVPDGAAMNVGNRAVRLKYLETLRRRTNIDTPDPGVGKAMEIYKRTLDRHIKQQFDRDMIMGDPEAVQAWREARLTREMQGELFDDNDVIMRLIEKDVTSEQMRNWIFGASTASGGSPKAATIVDQLKRILGEESPEFQGLREEFLYDVMEPLLQQTPNLEEFLKRYDRTVRRNHSLVKTLAPYNYNEVNSLHRFIQAAVDSGADPNLDINLNRILSQAMFGHEIAQAAMRRSLAEAAIMRLRGAGISGRRRMYNMLMQHDPTAPLIPKDSLAFAAIVAGAGSDVFSTSLPSTEENTDGDNAQ